MSQSGVILHSVTKAHFTPWTATQRPCWHCHHFDGLEGSGAALCGLRSGPRRRSMPAAGCSAFEREPGADDEPDRVPVTAICATRVWRPVELPQARSPVDWAP